MKSLKLYFKIYGKLYDISLDIIQNRYSQFSGEYS